MEHLQRLSTFSETYKTMLDKAVFLNNKAFIEDFIFDLTAKKSFFYFSTEDGLNEMTTKIFGNEQLRDFILDLQSAYFAVMIEKESDLMEMINSLSYSFAIHHTKINVDDNTIIPSAIYERTLSRDELNAFLTDNVFLVVVFLIRLFVTVVDSTHLGPGNE